MQSKFRPETRFFVVFSSFVHQFSLKLQQNLRKKKLVLNLVQRCRNRFKNQVFKYFLKYCLLVFLEIVCSDSLQQCLTCSRGKTLEKNFGAQIQAENQIFWHFLKFDSLDSQLSSYSDSLQQRLTTSRGRIYEKKIGPKFVTQVSKSVAKLGFLPFSQVWFVSFP